MRTRDTNVAASQMLLPMSERLTKYQLSTIKTDIQISLSEVISEYHDNIKKHMGDIIAVPPIDINSKKLTATLALTDLHMGELVYQLIPGTNIPVKTYDSRVATMYIDNAFNTFIGEILNIGMNRIDEIIIYLGGDIVDGEEIYAGQSENQDIVHGHEQLLCVHEILVYKILQISEVFRNIPIRVKCVPGNHGEMRGKYVIDKVIDNYDTLLYRLLSTEIIIQQRKENRLQNVELEYPVKVPILNWNVKGYVFSGLHAVPKKLDTPTNTMKLMAIQGIYGSNVLLTGHYHDSFFKKVGSNFQVIRIGAGPGPNEFSNHLAIDAHGPEQLIIFSNTNDPAYMILTLKLGLEKAKREMESFKERYPFLRVWHYPYS